MAWQVNKLESYRIFVSNFERSNFIILKSGARSVRVNFVDNPQNFEDRQVSPNNFYIHVEEKYYPRYVDCIRNESPIWFGLNDANYLLSIRTTDELPGDGDLE